MTKSKNKGTISFIGNNANEVTGSCVLLEYEDSRILIDCGMRQSSKEADDHRINSKLNKNVKPTKLDGVVITHIHLDHIGKIPLLYKRNAACPTFIPKGSKGLITLMLNDTVKIFNQEKDRKDRQPPYTQEHVDKALANMVEVDYEERKIITESIAFTYHYNQHIPKSRSVFIECTDGMTLKKIGFTGDFSTYDEDNILFLNSFKPLPQVDILISEATYSEKGRLHKTVDRDKDMEKLDTAIKEAKANGGKVIIPTFSNTRFQTILTSIYKYYKGDCPLPILCDSKLAHNISSMWQNAIDKDEETWYNVYRWDKIRWVTSPKERLDWAKLNESMIILCSGGFLQSGTGVFWTQSCLGQEKNRIVFCGYSSKDSIAGKIKEGKQKTINIEGKRIKNKAKVVVLNSFSSHADHDELLDYLTKAKYTTLYLVHSEQQSKIKFAKELKDNLSKANRTNKVVATEKDQKAYF